MARRNRLSREGLSGRVRARSSCGTQAEEGILLPKPSGAAPQGREGSDGAHLEAHFQGLSTRSVYDMVKRMGVTGLSKSQVSGLCEGIDRKVRAFLERPIEGDWANLWIGATYLKVRRGCRTRLRRP